MRPSRPWLSTRNLLWVLGLSVCLALLNYVAPLACSLRPVGVLPSLAPSPSASSLDARRRHASATTQCGHSYPDLVSPPATRAPLSAACQSTLLQALRTGQRPARDAPFEFPNACGLRWYSPSAACDLLQAAGSLLIVGDSLQRHLTQALFSVLSGNMRHGSALQHMLPREHPHLLDLCACDRMYDDHAEHGGDRRCRDASSANLGSSAPGSQTLMCPNWRRNHVHFWFVAAWQKPGEGDTPWTFRASDYKATIERMLREGHEDAAATAAAAAEAGAAAGAAATAATAAPTPTPAPAGTGLLVHFAPPVLHVGMAPPDRPDLVQYFVDPLFEGLKQGAAAQGAAERRRAVCVGLPARQANGPPQYMEKQGNHAVQPHNQWLGEECQAGALRAGVEVVGSGGSSGGGRGSAASIAYSGLWDSFAFTLNHTSHDGAHYDSRVNVLLAQILLNVVAGEMGVGGAGGSIEGGGGLTQ